MNQVFPVILSGGSGTRLWPLSRKGFPKQFLALTGDNSLFQNALQRIGYLKQDTSNIEVCDPIIVCNEQHRFLALEQMRELGISTAQLLLESSAKNTAPALSLAAHHALQQGADPVLVVLPADQDIQDEKEFAAVLSRAINVAARDEIAILGIVPRKAETGYGYIQFASQPGVDLEHQVLSFVEKPDQQLAEQYLASADYAWNGGLFVLKASVWLQALEQFRPDIHSATAATWSTRSSDGAFTRFCSEQFNSIPEDSIDYAVIEKCPESQIPIKMLALDAGWSDLGAWDALWELTSAQRDQQHNVIQGDVIAFDTQRCLLKSSGRLVAAAGIEDLVVIETADAVLVAHKEQSQAVKKIVQELQLQQREESNLHRKVHRPWGWYDSIDECQRFKVKRIMVKPGASLSLQKHHHRAEHWVVVKGTAEVRCGDKTMVLAENQSTYIPLGVVHRLANPGTIELEIIEVQSGSYLGEDDIVRLEDSYGRT